MKNKLELIFGKPDIGKPEIKNKETGEVESEEIKATVNTYTRFVLPFAFQLQLAPEKSEPSDLYYELDDKDALSYIKRRKYFTRESSSTLYERGQWLSICDKWEATAWGKAEIPVSLRGQEFKIGMLAPKLVLFEVPEIKQQQKRNILQTGFLYVDVYFSDNQSQSPQIDDLLVLNEFFRYFGMPYDSHASIFKTIFSKVPVTLDGKKTIASLNEPLEYYFERWAAMLEIPIKGSDGQYYQLFPRHWGNAAKAWMYNEANSNKADHWQVYADNRCFVWTVAFLKNGAETLKQVFEPNASLLNAKDYGHWIKLLNVDTPPFGFTIKSYLSAKYTHQSVSQFERQWTDERTYKRWEHDGTFYGFCYHSAAILAPPRDIVFLPSTSYYFDTTALLFYIRMSLFRFGRELSNLAPIQDKEKRREHLRDLREQFSIFTILYRFPMPSNQQQSLEMYEINRKYFDLENFFTEIQQEIDYTHEFLETVEANRLASAANRLANWGIPLAVGGLMIALFSMSDVNFWSCIVKDIQCSPDSGLLFQTGIVVIPMAIGVWILSKRKQNK